MHTGKVSNLGDLIDATIKPNKVAFIDVRDWERPQVYTFMDIDSICESVATALSARGLKRGCAVALIGRNSVAYFASYLGIMRAGMVAVLVNYKLPEATIRYILSDSDVEFALVEPEFSDFLRGVPSVELDDEVASRISSGPAGHREKASEVSITDPAMILYTSGSTGMPKGVVLSHESQIFALEAWDWDRQALSEHKMMVAAPLYHMNGLFLSKLSLYMGATTVLFSYFSPTRYARAIERFSATWLTGIPTMFALLLQESDVLSRTDLCSVKRIGLGSAPLTEGLIADLNTYFPSVRIGNIYGTTEHGASAFGPHPDGLPIPTRSIGYPSQNVGIRLVDGPCADEGVLEVKSPMNMLEYKNQEQKTCEKLRNGWCRTGDVMRRDAEGFFYFVGREDDMFVCNGENIFSGEVERLLETHPKIHQACVLPIVDPVRGAAPMVFIVRAGDLTEDEVQSFARQEGPPVQYPRRVIFVDQLPLSGTNKVDRNALKRRLQAIKLEPKVS